VVGRGDSATAAVAVNASPVFVEVDAATDPSALSLRTGG